MLIFLNPDTILKRLGLFGKFKTVYRQGDKIKSTYQLAFIMPGISPLSANSLKQIRHTPKSRINPRGLPQRWHRLCLRTGNFGFFFAFSKKDFLAKSSPLI
jgi:hypothetical protein